MTSSAQPSDSTAVHPRIGLLAGWGRYPLVVARTLSRQGFHVSCLAVKDHADARLAELCDDVYWIGLARLGAAIRYFRRQHVYDATMAGKFHKKLIFQPRIWLRHFPDWRTVRAFYPHFVTSKKDRKDDTLLGVICNEFASEGINFRPATDFVPELLVKRGVLTGGHLTTAQQADIRFGWELAKEMGRLDIGQSVCVKDRAVLAVEAIEGTDECIRRAGQLCPTGGFTIVKTAKPQQDMRFDVPTIGLGTLHTMIEAGAKTLVIEAERTIILDQEEVISLARRHRVNVVALAGELSDADLVA